MIKRKKKTTILVNVDIRSQNDEYVVILLQRISYSKKDSDVIAKMKGTFVERPKKKRHDDEEKSEKKKKKARGDRSVILLLLLKVCCCHP